MNKFFLIILSFFIIAAAQPDYIEPDQTNMRSISPVEITKQMIPGWNVGNSLEAIGGETAWGNPMITQQLMSSIKDAGFKLVRIPVAWSVFSDKENYTIKSEWKDRVEEVVNYVLNAGMYAIINIHWDGGWMQPTYAEQDEVNNRLQIMWKQIAIHFRDYNDSLLFAGTNEVMVEGDYGTPTEEYYTVQNSYNQTFVTTVRGTGGRNTYRFLLVQGFNTNINHTVNFFVTPGDPTDNKLIVEVHYYDPYNFTLNENSSITQWGENATDSSKMETWANESWADGQFQKMKTNFVDKGFGVIIGEYGAIARLNLGSTQLNEEHAEYRRYYIEYVTQSMVNHDLVPVYWDNGYTGDHGLGIFNRNTGEKVLPEIVEAITKVTIPINKINKFSPKNIKHNTPFIYKHNNRMQVDWNDLTISPCKLFNLSGQVLRTFGKILDIGSQSSGLYLLKVPTQGGCIITPVFKR